MLLDAAAGHGQRERLRRACDAVDDDVNAAAEGAREKVVQRIACSNVGDTLAVDGEDSVADAQALGATVAGSNVACQITFSCNLQYIFICLHLMP